MNLQSIALSWSGTDKQHTVVVWLGTVIFGLLHQLLEIICGIA